MHIFCKKVEFSLKFKERIKINHMKPVETNPNLVAFCGLYKKIKSMRKIILITISGAVLIGLLLVASTFLWMYLTVKNTCNMAEKKYPGKCQGALIKVLEDEKASPKEKNDAIWALGQMADPESLSALERIYAGKVPKGREPLNEIVSQYEIEKAIRWCKNGNSTSWMYRKL